MIKIVKPNTKVNTVILDCIDNMRPSNVKTEILNSNQLFENAEIELEESISKNELHKLLENNEINDILDADELNKLYTGRLVNLKNKGRVHYDRIFLSAKNGKCPLCAQRIVRTLDHYLPKSKYPLYSVIPINLIPSCTDCNKDKLVDTPTKSEEETLHPYYDDVENEEWLKMKILSNNPFSIEFYVQPSLMWSDLLNKRIDFHFKTFLLNKLYCIHAKEEFNNIKGQLDNLFTKLGTEDLKAHLLDCYRSRLKISKNSWQTAFYECLSTNEEFLDGAFL